MSERKTEIRIRREGESAEEVIPVHFDDSGWELLERFVENVERLETAEMIQQRRNVNLNISFDDAAGLTTSVSLPPDREIREFLHLLRPIILEKEPASFIRTVSLLGKRLEDAHCRAFLSRVRQRFNSRLAQDLVRFEWKDTVLNSEATLRLWLNAYEYHNDAEKRERLDELHRIFPLEASRALFLSLLIEKAQASQMVAVFIEFLLGRRHKLEFKLSQI